MPIKGLGEARRNLDKLKSKMEEIDGVNSVPMGELFNPGFISKHTRFQDVDELFKAGCFECETEEQFKAIPQEKMDAFIAKESSFSDWQAMSHEAIGEWLKKQLSF